MMGRFSFIGIEREDGAIVGRVPDGRPFEEWTSSEHCLWQIARMTFHRYKVSARGTPVSARQADSLQLRVYFTLASAVMVDANTGIFSVADLRNDFLWRLSEGVAAGFPRGSALKFELCLRPNLFLSKFYSVILRVESGIVREKRVDSCRRAVMALLKCLSMSPRTPRDVDLLLAQTLWTTRLQEDWNAASPYAGVKKRRYDVIREENKQ